MPGGDDVWRRSCARFFGVATQKTHVVSPLLDVKKVVVDIVYCMAIANYCGTWKKATNLISEASKGGAFKDSMSISIHNAGITESYC